MTTPKQTIDDATHEEWVAAQRKLWYEKSAKTEGDSCVSAGACQRSPTPRTRAASAICSRKTPRKAFERMREHAETLERELADANAELFAIRAIVGSGESLSAIVETVLAERDAEIAALNAKLRSLLQKTPPFYGAT